MTQPVEPRTWAIPEQPCDVHTVRGVPSGTVYQLDDNGDWWCPTFDDPDQFGESWEDVLLTERTVVDASHEPGSGAR